MAPFYLSMSIGHDGGMQNSVMPAFLPFDIAELKLKAVTK
jgi:hypothetical protein